MAELALAGLALIGAATQSAIGVGFSIIVGPVLVMGIGAQAAVPALLVLNLAVSLVAAAAADAAAAELSDVQSTTKSHLFAARSVANVPDVWASTQT